MATAANGPMPVVSVSPVVLPATDRGHDLRMRVSAPATGAQLPIIVSAHNFGSSLDGYAPLVHYWAAHGFVVIQPTFLDSRTLRANPQASHSEAIKASWPTPASPTCGATGRRTWCRCSTS